MQEYDLDALALNVCWLGSVVSSWRLPGAFNPRETDLTESTELLRLVFMIQLR